MAKDAAEIVVGGTGAIYVAPAGTPLPTDIDEALNGAFVELGFTDEDGATFRDGKTTERVGVWQRFHPARIIVTERSAVASFNLRQWSEATVELAFGGGTFTPTANGQMYEPPDPQELDERAMVVQVEDGTKKARICIANGLVTEDVETNFARTSAADLPIAFEALATDDDEKPWYLLGNDAFWNEAS